MFDIQEELKKLPARPGVYLMRDARDEIIYVGKAVVLKNRVRQYFQDSRNKGPKIERMVQQIARFEYIVTESEMEALVLECNLIKEYRPRYNTMLTDDKSYPFIKVTVGEAYPRVLFSRQMHKDKSRYYGPYTSAGAVKDVIELVRKLYKIRSCNRKLPRDMGRERPCLYYHIHQCDAPCQGYITEEAYREHIEEAIAFLNGDSGEVLERLKQQMEEASREMRFEDAGMYRDLIEDIRRIGERQKVTSSDARDRDVIAMASDREDAVVQVFFIRQGKLIGRDHFYVRIAVEDTTPKVLESFIKQYYAGTPLIPAELILQEMVEDAPVLEEWLTGKRGQRVSIHAPQKGNGEKLVQMAAENAQMVLSRDRERIKREEGRTIGAVKEIAEWLNLANLQRIEAYDISNLNGFESVGSMVVYEKGKPRKNDYRKFRIRSVQGPNDYASLMEVLTRRFTHESGKDYDSFSRLPDLILMDGGKGQVHAALEALANLGISIPVCGMVKDDRHRTRGLYYQDREISANPASEGFKLIARIQDEAHRFAISYHRSLRSKEQVHSVLDDIPDIGPARRKALMRQYPSIDQIRNADREELAALPSMNEKSAASVYDFFHKNDMI